VSFHFRDELALGVKNVIDFQLEALDW